MLSAGDFDFSTTALRGLRTNWLIVGILFPPFLFPKPTHPGGSFLNKIHIVV